MTNPDTDKCAELRERADVLYKWYPDQHTPMDTLEFTAKSHGVIRDLLAALDEMQGVVERLPVTADGVRVVPGDTVLWLRIGPRGGVRIERVKVGCEGEIGTWWCSDNCNSMGDEWELLQDSLADCYATIEAVEAALPARKEKEDDN